MSKRFPIRITKSGDDDQETYRFSVLDPETKDLLFERVIDTEDLGLMKQAAQDVQQALPEFADDEREAMAKLLNALIKAQQQAGTLASGSGNGVDQTKMQQIEQLLQELKQEQQRAVVQQPVQPQPRNARRFRLAPTGSVPAENGPDPGTTGRTPARPPHPLGATTPDPVKRTAHPLSGI